MDQKILPCWSLEDFQLVNEQFASGWVLNPNINDGRPIILSDAVVYHLVFYSKEDIGLIKQNGEMKITSLKSVPIDEVDTWLAQGYEVEQMFAKTANVVKRAVKNGS